MNKTDFSFRPSNSIQIYQSFFPFLPAYLSISFCLCVTQVRRRVSAGSSSDRRELRLQDVGSNIVSTSCRTQRSCWRYGVIVWVRLHLSLCGKMLMLQSTPIAIKTSTLSADDPKKDVSTRNLNFKVQSF